MRKSSFIFILGVPIALGSCQPQNPYKGPPIPLSKALTAISDGMREADTASKGKKSTGLIPSKATVAFNIVNSDKTTQGLSLSVVPVAGLTAGGTLGREFSTQGTSAITVEYSSVLLASKDSIVGNKTPEEVEKLLDQMKNQITTFKKKTDLLNLKNLELEKKIELQNKALELQGEAPETE